MKTVFGFVLFLLCSTIAVHGFVGGWSSTAARPSTTRVSASASAVQWMDEFRLHNGEVLNPYRVLKVDRKAERPEIRQRYLELSRRYHPDAARHRDILPGSWYVEENDMHVQFYHEPASHFSFTIISLL